MERTTIAAIFADQEALGGQTVTVCAGPAPSVT